MARVLFDLERPTVGLLNIGVEEVKGLEEVREAGRILREAQLPHLDYVGFVEGDDIGKGTVDVVVTEGFAGNIALKTAEGTARQIGEYPRAAMSRTLAAKLGYLFARGAFRALRDKMDPRKVERRRLPRPQRHRHQEPRRHRRRRLRRRDRSRLRHGPPRPARQDRRRRSARERRRRRRAALVGGSQLVTMIRVPSSSAAAAICPSRVLTNAELAQTVDTSDEWIVQRTGIRERHIAARRRDDLRPGPARGARARSRTPRSTRSRST